MEVADLRLGTKYSDSHSTPFSWHSCIWWLGHVSVSAIIISPLKRGSYEWQLMGYKSSKCLIHVISLCNHWAKHFICIISNDTITRILLSPPFWRGETGVRGSGFCAKSHSSHTAGLWHLNAGSTLILPVAGPHEYCSQTMWGQLWWCWVEFDRYSFWVFWQEWRQPQQVGSWRSEAGIEQT